MAQQAKPNVSGQRELCPTKEVNQILLNKSRSDRKTNLLAMTN